MYTTANDLLEQARMGSLIEVILENEMTLSAIGREAVYQRMEGMLSVMEAAAMRALEGPLPTVGGLIEGNAHHQHQYAKSDTLCGGPLNRMMAYALSGSETNASMGRICAAPTAGACGILPAVLLYMRDLRNISRETLLDALLIASAIGAIVMRNATVAGAEAGCQAECGVAAAMAAGACVWLCGEPDNLIFDAAAMALSNCMGLICDPVAGLVQVPCALRNASQAMNALLCADMARAGVRNVIPFDETVAAMYRTGKMLPQELRETAEGGIAATPTAKRIAQDIFGR